MPEFSQEILLAKKWRAQKLDIKRNPTQYAAILAVILTGTFLFIKYRGASNA